MELKNAFISQYIASLNMLEETINKADDTIWLNKKYTNPFWQIAYHALFYTDFYLYKDEKSFIRWEKFKDGYHRMANNQQTSEGTLNIEPYKREEIIEYLKKNQNSLIERLEVTNLEAPSGFHWLPFNKFELQIYNIRHLQHHTGQLIERTREEAGVGIGWATSRQN